MEKLMTDPKEPEVAEVVPETETDTQSDEVTQLKAELEKAQTEAANNYEQFLRTQAELANQRRRADKQIEDAHKYAAQKFVEALLPVVDSLEMGMQAQGDVEQIREGMALTLKQFESMMDKFHIEAVGKPGDVFNPELHQAVSMQPHPDYDNNQVSMVMQKGYTLNGRVIRPAMVMVSKK
jgi:molecular chaperone GrpE